MRFMFLNLEFWLIELTKYRSFKDIPLFKVFLQKYSKLSTLRIFNSEVFMKAKNLENEDLFFLQLFIDRPEVRFTNERLIKE